ncbi:hypothetical protein D3C87_63620 [compost metagenome]
MKSLLILLLWIGWLFNPVFSQENLVPNGNLNNGTYRGGMNPVEYYTANDNCKEGRERFEKDISYWKVAKTGASFSDVYNADNIRRRCSPDWIGPGTYDHGTECYSSEPTYYVASGYFKESIMVELKDGYKLKKGQSYKFRIKARSARGSGNFQLVFSADKDGLHTNSNKKWVAADEFYMPQSCDWKYFEVFFNVPTNNDKKYEDMKYLVLQYNHDGPGSEKIVIHYDDVFLAEGQKCEDIKYIQDWKYVNTNKIEQANIEIRAGAHVSPYSWPANNPVVVKSTAMVIYRAPTVYLEPGFFIEEEGSYFETQVGTCVEDPCPGIPGFTSPGSVQCSESITLGTDFPEVPGVFYVWEPANYFTAPWSRTTEVRPPDSDDGCVNAKLTIWTICGATQVHDFKLQFIKAAPEIDLVNVNSNLNGITGYLNLQNATDYTIQGINTVTGEIVFEDQYTWDCNKGTQHIPFVVDRCTGNLCHNLEIKITASNPCFVSVSETIQWVAPIVTDYDLQVSNLVSTDYEFHFDWNIPGTYEYVKIQVWNEAKTQKICEWNYDRCSNPISTTNPFHFDIRDCLGQGCLAQCKNYKVVLETKQYCNTLISTKEIAWNKSSTTFAMPVNYPNIIVADNNGENDVLCFEPTGADYYHIWVDNRWGNPMFEDEGCVDEIPICLWAPTNITDGVYTYTIQFGNQCGDVDEMTTVATVFAEMIQNNNPQEIQNSGAALSFDQSGNETNIRENSVNSSSWNVNVYPNPAEDVLFIQSSEEITHITIRDITGKVILTREIRDRNTSINMSTYASGYYILNVNSQSGIKLIDLVKQ